MSKEITTFADVIDLIGTADNPQVVKPSVREASIAAATGGLGPHIIQENAGNYAYVLKLAGVPDDDVKRNTSGILEPTDDGELVAMKVDLVSALSHPVFLEKMKKVQRQCNGAPNFDNFHEVQLSANLAATLDQS